MSGLITKTTKRRSSASGKVRSTKAKKAPSRKPTRPGRITASPKAKKASPAKKLVVGKKRKPPTSLKGKNRPVKKHVVKKKSARATAATNSKRPAGRKPPAKKAAAKVRVTRKPTSRAASRKAMLARRRMFAPRPLPAPPKKPPSPGTLAAVRAFEQALRLFNRHDFGPAKSAFENLLKNFADQAEIVARVRTYMVICEHRLGRAAPVPRNPDALYNQGVFELNKGNPDDAIELFGKALKVDPRADHVYYSLAAAYARLNEASKALDALRRAIGIRPVHRSHARRDLDFVDLRSNEDFQQLTGFGFDLVEE